MPARLGTTQLGKAAVQASTEHEIRLRVGVVVLRW
jgi:hypothetical protein